MDMQIDMQKELADLRKRVERLERQTFVSGSGQTLTIHRRELTDAEKAELAEEFARALAKGVTTEFEAYQAHGLL